MEIESDSRKAAGDGKKAAAAAFPEAAAGAPPSITAPANCIRPLRHGVDSLYLSFAGQIDPDLAMRLQELKLFAQATNEHGVARASIALGDHFLTVLPRGRGRFAFVLEDNWFSIQLSNASAGVLPLAMAQIRSEYLTAVGPEEAIRTATELVGEMGETREPPKISRLDLFADFSGTYDLASLPGHHWVKRCKTRAIHEEADALTGVTFGPGNEVSARLYDKTREILRSGKDYMRPLWAMEGWGGEQVWRMEFQVRRDGLPNDMRGPASDALGLCGNLWRYLCAEWLRLAIPSDSDDTRSRWPTHPVWEDLTRLWDIDPEAPPLSRVSKARLPSDDRLFRHGISGLSSFMAREGITDLDEGLGEFLHAMHAYFEDPQREFPEGLRDYIRRKTKAKARRYNVPLSEP